MCVPNKRMAAANSFFFIWTTPPETFLPRHLRAIESICFWHRDAAIRGLSNTLPLDFFSALSEACDIRIERYDLAKLVQNHPAEVWYEFRRYWSRSAYFSNHEADLLRLLRLRAVGGVYVDVDVIFLRPFRLGAGCINAIGIESGGGGLSAAQAATADRYPSYERNRHDHAIVCNAVMRFAAGTPLLERALDTFVREYVPLTPGYTASGILNVLACCLACCRITP